MRTLNRCAPVVLVVLLSGCSSLDPAAPLADAATDAAEAGPQPAATDAGAGADATSDAAPGSDADAAAPRLGDGGDAGDGEAGPLDYVPGVIVSTLAGAADAGAGDGDAAAFDNPVGVALTPAGDLVVTEYDGSRVRRLTARGEATTLAQASGFVGPFAIAAARDGTIVVQTDYDRAGAKSLTSGTLWRLAADGGLSPLAEGLGRPRGLGAMADGRVAVADRLRHTLHALDLRDGGLTPLAGDGADGGGFADGVGGAARFNLPHGVAALPDGTLLVADTGNHRIRRVTGGSAVATYAGDGTPGGLDGPRMQARFDSPRDVAVDAAGNVYVTEIGGHRIRVITAAGTVRTVAGDGTAGFRDGAGVEARFFGQEAVEVTADGKTIYVADGNGGTGAGYHRVRRITVP